MHGGEVMRREAGGERCVTRRDGGGNVPGLGAGGGGEGAQQRVVRLAFVRAGWRSRVVGV